MLRGLLIFAALAALAVWALGASPADPASAALVQMQNALDAPRHPLLRAELAAPTLAGLSLRGIGATLGVGALTAMLFLPAVALTEYLARWQRRDSPETK